MPGFRIRKRTPQKADYIPLKGENLSPFECFVRDLNMPFRRNTDESGSREPLFDASNPVLFDFNTAIEGLPPQQKTHGERLRRHLQFFFMDPVNKYKLRKQFPFKLALQILKVLFVSIQLILFADLRISHVDFLEDTVTVMRHKFLRDWDHERDSVTYPPEAGRYSVFTSKDLIEHMSHIVTAYYNLQNESFASFSYNTIKSMNHDYKFARLKAAEFAEIPPLNFCIKKLANVQIENQTYIFDISETTNCFKLNFSQKDVDNIKENPMAIKDFFSHQNLTFRPEDALIIQKAFVKFKLRTIHFSPTSMDQKPECYLIEISIDFDNTRHTGQVFIKLEAVIKYVNLCNGRVLQVNGVSVDAIIVGVLDVLVLSMCLFSLLLCCRALFRAHRLMSMTVSFFHSVFKQKLTIKDELSFLNMWYVMIVINDVCIVTGTVCKIAIEFRDFDNSMFTMTGVLLGIGCLLVYIGLFRYLGFFNQYNVLILTLKRALPSIGRFMICTIILYVGFLIAGWVIIGPYSIKFRTLAQSSEALFSLMNGDDMFATFYTINDSNSTIKLIGTLYIYLFVCLFIYVVLSLFIAIIMDAYEVVREKCNRGVVVEKSTLQEFLASSELPQDLGSGETRDLFASDQLIRLDDELPNAWHHFVQSCRHLWTSSEVDYSNLDNRNGQLSLQNLSR